MMASSTKTLTGISSCIHRGITRLTSEQLLLDKADGSFLIRESETIPGAFTLCLLYDNHVHQYRILPDAEGKLSVQCEATVRSKKFTDLTQLILEYTQRGQKNGLAGALLYPVPVESALSEDESDEDLLHDDTLQFEISAPTDNAEGEMMSRGDQKEFADFIYRYFLQRFKHLNMSSCDGAFTETLRKYVESGTAIDCRAASSGEKTMRQLCSVLDQSALEIDRCIDSLMLKIDLCRQLFGPMTTNPLSKAERMPNEKVDISSVLERMARCKGAIQNLERKAELKYRDLTSMWKEGGLLIPDAGNTSPSRGMPTKPMIPAMSFEAKVSKLGKLSKIKLTVDIQAGKLLAVKPNKETLNDRNVFMHAQIEQLIKSSQKKSHLDVIVSGTKRTYIFEDMKQRENFCQLVQQLKNMHDMDNDNISQISIFVGTWNMGSEIPPYGLAPWIISNGQGKKLNNVLSAIPHDIYVIGTQESVISDKEWSNKLKILLLDTFGEQFHVVTCCSLWSIRIVVLVKLKHKNKISLVQQSTVRTGIANALGNKGAVAVSLSFNGTSMCFVCSHLASGLERLKRRNQNFRDIIKGLNLGPKILNQFDSTNQFHHMFFFGDLNYRLDDLTPTDIVQKIEELQPTGTYNVLLEFDQLKRVQKSKEAFVGFREEDISFMPTYRFRKGTKDRYVWEKQKTTGLRINAPSWCDRVLWRSYPDTRITNTSYGSVDCIHSSDHKPVFATFDVRVITQFTTPKGGSASSGDMKIVFTEIKAEVKCSKQENFKIGFHSTCLEVPVDSKQNGSFGNKKSGYCCPNWTSSNLPELQPILDDWDYLEDQHVLLSIKTADGLESYGECVVALKTMFSVKPQQFSATLTHIGEETGTIWGLMHVKARENSDLRIHGPKSRKAYELIYMDTELMLDDGAASAAASAQIYQDVVELRPTSISSVSSSKASQPQIRSHGLSVNHHESRSKSVTSSTSTNPNKASPWLRQSIAGAEACVPNHDTDLKKKNSPESAGVMNKYSDWPVKPRTEGCAIDDFENEFNTVEHMGHYEDVGPSVPPRNKQRDSKQSFTMDSRTSAAKPLNSSEGTRQSSRSIKGLMSSDSTTGNSFPKKDSSNTLEKNTNKGGTPLVSPKPGSFKGRSNGPPRAQIRSVVSPNDDNFINEALYSLGGNADLGEPGNSSSTGGGYDQKKYSCANDSSPVYSEEMPVNSNISTNQQQVNKPAANQEKANKAAANHQQVSTSAANQQRASITSTNQTTASHFLGEFESAYDSPVTRQRVIQTPRSYDQSKLGQSDLIDLSSPANTLRGDVVVADPSGSQDPDINTQAVSDWLSSIGLSQYRQDFIDNGWDHMDFISDITLEDLQQMGIPTLDHRLKILASIEQLKKGDSL